MKPNSILLTATAILITTLLTGCSTLPDCKLCNADPQWIPLFDGNSIDDWTVRGHATWEVKDGVLIGVSKGGQGHIYATPELRDLEVKGTFRLTPQGKTANSGLYFRANPPADNPNGYPKGYEAQLCNSQSAFTGWLWKPGTPTGKASALLAKDNEWFTLRAKAVGNTINIWVNGTLVTTHTDEDYTQGFFALQCHNDGMTIEAKDLYYRDLSK